MRCLVQPRTVNGRFLYISLTIYLSSVLSLYAAPPQSKPSTAIARTLQTRNFSADMKTALKASINALQDLDYTNLLDLSVPVLGGVDLHAGAGMNQHIAAPFMSLSLMESLLGEDLFEEFDEEAMAKKILDYMEENSETVQGFHVQAGLQFKILVLTAILNVRYTIVEDLYPDTSAFPSINLNIGFGI